MPDFFQTHDTTDCARRAIWTRDRWRVVHSVSLFGLSDRWYALEHDGVAWQKIRACRAEAAAWRAIHKAMRAADRAARREAKREERRKQKGQQNARRQRAASRRKAKLCGALRQSSLSFA